LRQLADECEVVGVKREHTDGYTALQLGAGRRKLKRTRPAVRGQFARAGVMPKAKLEVCFFVVSPCFVMC
jgi:large subunit ribosomal protein L3